MCNVSIGKNEIVNLKNREQEVLKELEIDNSSSCKQGNTVYNFKTLRLQRELRLLQTKLKLLDADCDNTA